VRARLPGDAAQRIGRSIVTQRGEFVAAAAHGRRVGVRTAERQRGCIGLQPRIDQCREIGIEPAPHLEQAVGVFAGKAHAAEPAQPALCGGKFQMHAGFRRGVDAEHGFATRGAQAQAVARPCFCVEQQLDPQGVAGVAGFGAQAAQLYAVERAERREHALVARRRQQAGE